MTADEELGRRIAMLRERRGVAQAELARQMRRAGHLTLTPGRIWEIEQGRRAVRAVEVADLCRILQAPCWWILGMEREEALGLERTWSNTEADKQK